MRVSAVVVALLACGSAACGGTQATPETPALEPNETLEGSRVSVHVPDGFERIPHQPGWVNLETNVTLMIAEGTVTSPAEAEQWVAGYLQGVSVSRGGADWQVREASDRTFYSSPDTLTYGVVLREDQAVAALLVLVPERAHAELAEQVLASATLDAGAPLDALAILQAELDVAPGLVASQSASVAALFVPEEGPVTPGAPLVRVQHVLLEQNLDERALGQLLGGAVRALQPDTESMAMERGETDGLETIRVATSGRQAGVSVWIDSRIVVQRDEEGRTVGAFLLIASAADAALREPIGAMLDGFRLR